MTKANESVPALVKVAMMVGAVAGTSLAVYNNRDRILETAEQLLELGAQYCREKLEESRQQRMAAVPMEVSDEFHAADEKDVKARTLATDYYDDFDEPSTPDPLDAEIYDDALDLD